MRRFAYFVLALGAALRSDASGIENVRVQGTTATAAIIAYTAPDQGACTLKVSRTAALAPLEADVDPDLFPGVSSDARPGNLTRGRQRIFVVGTRGAAHKAANGKYVSRALQADTEYYFQIDCPASGDRYPASPGDPNTFRTSNIALGNTYNDPPPADPANPGAYAFPDLDYSSRNAGVVDPITGFGAKPVSFPGDMWSAPGNLAFGSAYNASGLPCADGGWSAPCGAIAAADPAARSTGSGEWLILRPENTNISAGTPYYPDIFTSVDYLELSLTGSGDSAVPLYRTAEVCLSTDGGVSCATTVKEAIFDQGSYTTKIVGPLPGTNGTFGADPWLSSAKITIPQMNTHFGSVTVAGSDVTLKSTLYNNENAYFRTDWKRGSRIQLTNNVPAPTAAGQGGGQLSPNTNYYFKVVAEYPNLTFSDANERGFTTGSSQTAVSLSWPASPGATQYRVYVGTAAGGENSYFVSGTNSYTVISTAGTAGLVPAASYAECQIEQVKNGRSLSLQDPACITNANFTAVDVNVYRAQNFVVMLRRKAVDATRPADGVSVQYAAIRYITSSAGGWPSTGGTTVCSRQAVDGGYYCGIPVGNGGFNMLYWIDSVTGNAVPLGRMSVNPKTSGPAEDQWYSSQGCGPNWDNAKPNPTFHCLVTSASGKKVIVQGELLPCPGKPCFSHASPAAGYSGSSSLGSGAATSTTYSVTYANGVRWTVLNPPSLGQDLVSQMKALDATFDEINFSTIGVSGVQNGSVIFVAHHGAQDTISFVGAFSPGDGDPSHAGQPQGPRVSALMNTWSGDPKCRWCTRHSMLGAGDSDYAIIEANVAINSSTAWGGGPWQVTSNTEILNDAGPCPENPYGATDCVSLTINPKMPLAYPAGDSRNYEPYDPNPGAGETQYTGPGALTTAQPGDLVCVSGTTSCNFVTNPWNEVMRLIQKTGNTWIFQRNVTSGNNKKKAITGTGTKYLFFTCTAIHPTRPGVLGGITYWHFTDDPHGKKTEIDLYNFGSHQVFRPGFYTEAYGNCPLSSQACYATRRASVPALFSMPIASKQNGNPPFAGATGPGSPTQKQSHPTYPNTDSSDYEKQAYFDVRPFINSGSYAFTQVDTNVYRASWPASDPDNFGPFNRKKVATEAYCGPHPLVDVSGPESIIDASTPYTYCIPRTSNSSECQDAQHSRTTVQGQVYVSCPYITHTSCQGANAFLFENPTSTSVDGGGKNLVQDICVTNTAAQGQAVTQISTANDSFGQSFRRLSILTGRNKLGDVFSSARTLPDGSQILWRWYWGDLFRSEVMAGRLPRLPAPDSVNRGDFIPVTIKLARTPSGTQNVVAEFGYEENRGLQFADPIPPCTTRQEGCLSGKQPADDFRFASEAVEGVPCAPGAVCVVGIPAVPQRILYYRILYRDGSNRILTRSAEQVLAIP